jgi:hypothetical protein
MLSILLRYRKPSFSVNTTLLLLNLISRINKATYFTQSRSSSSQPVLQNVKVQGDQKVSVHLMITITIQDAQRLFDHPII